MANDAPKSRLDLSDNAKKTSIGVLQAVLTDSIDLYNTTRHAHWNVKGPQFHSLHELFETFYKTLEGDIDEVAERLARGVGLDTPARMPRLHALARRLAPLPPFASTEP